MKDHTKLRKVDLDKLINFYTLFRHGSIAKASAATNVPANTYYYDLRVLEEAFDTKLYMGGKKNWVLTEEGIKLAELSREILNKLEVIKDTHNEFLTGEIVIHTTVTLGLHYLPTILQEFSQKYPSIKVKLLLGPEYLSSRYSEFDIRIASYVDNRVDLSQQLLKTFEYGYFASKGYIEKFGIPKSEDELINHSLLLFTGEHYLPENIIHGSKHIIEANSYPTLVELCLKDLGICSLSLDIYSLLLKENKTKYSSLQRILPNIISESDKVHFSFFRFTSKEKPIRDMYEICKILIK